MARKPYITFSPEVCDKICDEIASGRSLRSICLDDGMPHISAVMNWLNKTDDKKYQPFIEQYARARDTQAEVYFDEIVQIADDSTNDIELLRLDDGQTKESISHAAIQRARLQIDARKWALSKMKPKKYGDKLAIGGDDDMPPIQTVTVSAKDIAEMKAAIDEQYGSLSKGTDKDTV